MSNALESELFWVLIHFLEDIHAFLYRELGTPCSDDPDFGFDVTISQRSSIENHLVKDRNQNLVSIVAIYFFELFARENSSTFV